MPGLPFEQLPAQNDPLAMLDQMTRQQLADLDQQVIQAEQQATAESSNRLQTLQQEYGIERRGLEQEWNQILNMGLDSEALQKTYNRMRLEALNLNKKYELAGTRISGKNRPDLLQIQQAKQNAITKINQQTTARQQEIAFWQRAEQELGIDPYVAKAGQLRALGYEVSASQLRPASIQDQIREIDAQVDLLRKSTMAGGPRPTALTISETNAKIRDLYVQRDQLARQMGGQYAGPMQTATRLQRVASQQAAGPFAQGIAEQKPGKKKLTREAIAPYIKAGISIEKAKEMLSNEYEIE